MSTQTERKVRYVLYDSLMGCAPVSSTTRSDPGVGLGILFISSSALTFTGYSTSHVQSDIETTKYIELIVVSVSD